MWAMKPAVNYRVYEPMSDGDVHGFALLTILLWLLLALTFAFVGRGTLATEDVLFFGAVTGASFLLWWVPSLNDLVSWCLGRKPQMILRHDAAGRLVHVGLVEP